MAQREGTVYLGLFVASFILFICALVGVFYFNNELEEKNGEAA